jgi:hypothetical protein
VSFIEGLFKVNGKSEDRQHARNEVVDLAKHYDVVPENGEVAVRPPMRLLDLKIVKFIGGLD